LILKILVLRIVDVGFRVLISLMEKWVGNIETQVLDATMKTSGPRLSRYLLPFSVAQCLSLRGAKVLSFVDGFKTNIRIGLSRGRLTDHFPPCELRKIHPESGAG